MVNKTKLTEKTYTLHGAATPEAIEKQIQNIKGNGSMNGDPTDAAAREATNAYCKRYAEAVRICDLGDIAPKAVDFFNGFEAGVCYMVERIDSIMHSHFHRTTTKVDVKLNG